MEFPDEEAIPIAADRPIELLEAKLASIERKLDLIERDSHGARAVYVGNNRILVKAVVGGHNIAYYVEADDRLISPWFIITGSYEVPLTDFFLREVRPDSHCLDVGSNFGFFACLMARLAPQGRLAAIEADAHVHELCRDNLAINGLDGVARAIHAAASDSDASLTLYRRTGRSGNTSIVSYDRAMTDQHGEPPVEAFSVSGLKLDDLLPRFDGRIDFIKIDVEGSEPLALRGARQIIESNPQLSIVMEWSPGQINSAGFDVADFVQELVDQKLAFFTVDGAAPRPISPTELPATDYMAGVLMRRC